MKLWMKIPITLVLIYSMFVFMAVMPDAINYVGESFGTPENVFAKAAALFFVMMVVVAIVVTFFGVGFVIDYVWRK